jgi:hypothetical protein
MFGSQSATPGNAISPMMPIASGTMKISEPSGSRSHHRFRDSMMKTSGSILLTIRVSHVS